MAYERYTRPNFVMCARIGRLRQVECVGSEYDMIMNQLDGMT